ncbi:MAG: hypothetical protein EU550_01610 [Promethearchaeota archaeon]|nr:MAG: hypothetical protein EU550_01610 [Candidatus Lokiarchaeota archaeon]
MKNFKKKILFLIIVIALIIPINWAAAFNFIDYLEEGESIFFLVALKENDSLYLKVNHEPNKNFTLFLFNFRPTQTNINQDSTLDPSIFNVASAYNVSDQPSLRYNATSEKIYYIQLILIKNGSALFTLISNRDLSRYYLPQIRGFIPFIIFSVSVVLSGLFLFLKRKSIFVKKEK